MPNNEPVVKKCPVSAAGSNSASAVTVVDVDASINDGSTSSVSSRSPHKTHDAPAQQGSHPLQSMLDLLVSDKSNGTNKTDNGDTVTGVEPKIEIAAFDELLKQLSAGGELKPLITHVSTMVLPEIHHKFDENANVRASSEGSTQCSDAKLGSEHPKVLESSNSVPKLSAASQPANLDREAQLEEFLKIIPGSKENLRRLTRNNPLNTGGIAPPIKDGLGLTNRLPSARGTFDHENKLVKDSKATDASNISSARLFLRPPNTPVSPVMNESPTATSTSTVQSPQHHLDPYISHLLAPDSDNNGGVHASPVTSCVGGEGDNFSSHFDDSIDVMKQLQSVFIPSDMASDSCAVYSSSTHSSASSGHRRTLELAQGPMEWFPPEPCMINNSSQALDDIAKLFDDSTIPLQMDQPDDDILRATNLDDGFLDADAHVRMLQHIHESLHTTADVSSLRTLEKFLVDLLQPDSDFGSLTSHGRLLAFINLAALRRHMFLLIALYQHPEMSVIRDILCQNEEGSIRRVLAISEAMANGQLTEDAGNAAIKELISNIGREFELHNPVSVRKSASKNQIADSPVVGGRGRPPLSPALLNVKPNRHLLNTLDELSLLYKLGGEAHFPRFVCGSIDRTRARTSETLSIPFDKVDRRNIHVQFEAYDSHYPTWPVLTYIPQTLVAGLRVQVNSSKQQTSPCWTLGTVTSVSSGMVMILVDGSNGNDASRLSGEGAIRLTSCERMFMTRNFVPPNVPSTRIEKAQWRLLPCDLNIERDIYVGSCLSLFDATLGGFVDMVILNIFYGEDERGGIAPVKSPMDETLFNCTKDGVVITANGDTDFRMDESTSVYDGCGSDISPDRLSSNMDTDCRMRGGYTCHCNGHTLRVFEGRCLGRRPRRLVLSSLSERKVIIMDISKVIGYKLNYDLQAHFDFHTEGQIALSSTSTGSTAFCHFQHCVWVIPRHLRHGEVVVGEVIADKVGSQWLFEPERCLMIFPYNRSVDILQDSARLISFLHPELNYTALCTGIWNVRCGGRGLSDVPHLSGDSVVPADPQAGRNETASYTRSQKAATRDLKLSEIVKETCSGVVRTPVSIVRRLLGCHSVISLWMALDGITLQNVECSNPNLSVKIPLKPRCTTCGGDVYASDDITKTVSLVPNNTDNDKADSNGVTSQSTDGGSETYREIAIFSDLEATEAVMQRIQSLVMCRWRLTRDYTASSTVDDDLIPLPNRSHHYGNTSPQLRVVFGKSTFINKFVQLMSSVKRSRNFCVDDMLYRRAFQWSDRYFNTRGIEATLMCGWGSFLTNKKTTDDVAMQSSHPGPGFSCHLSSSDLHGVPSPGHLAKHYSGDRGTTVGFNGLHGAQYAGGADAAGSYASHKGAVSPYATQEVGTGRRRRALDPKGDTVRGRINVKSADNVGPGRVSSVDPDKKPPRAKKSRLARMAENGYCEFKDKAIRFRFVSVVKWDEDLESGSLAT